MTKSILIITAISAFSFSTSAQTETSKSSPKWKISSFGLEFGMIRDTYNKMDLETMYDFTKNPALLDRNLNGYTERLFRESGGVRMGANVTLTTQHPASKWGSEIRLGTFYSQREPMISYDGPIVASADPFMFNNESVVYCNVVNEVSLDGAYLLRRTFGKKGWFSYYGGLGVNLGSSFKSDLVVMETLRDETQEDEWLFTMDTYEAKSSLFTRLYIPVGFQVSLFNKVNMGIETNVGIGMQSVFGGSNYFMPFNMGGTLRLGYNL